MGWMQKASESVASLVDSYRSKAAGNPTSIFNALSGPPSSNSTNFQKTLEQYRHFRDWVFAAIRPIAQTIAGQPIHLARYEVSTKKKRGKPGGPKSQHKCLQRHFLPDNLKADFDQLEKIDNHDLLEALQDPNELFVYWTLMFTTVASLLLTGRAYWWFWWDETKGKWEIWPIPSAWITPKHEGRFNANYELRVPGVGGTIDLDGSEILPFVMPDPGDPFGSLSTLQTQAKAAMADEAIQQSQVSAFQRGIQPGLAIVVGDNVEGALAKMAGGAQRPLLERDQRQQILNAIKLMNQGVLKAGEPVILDALISDIYPITNTPAEMDWLQSGNQIKSRLFQAFGVNPIIAGEVEGANRASSAAAEEHFDKFTVNPLAAMMSQVISAWIGPNFAKKGEKLVAWIEPAVPDDPDTKLRELQFLLSIGGLTLDQYLAEYGYPPLPSGGDVRPVPFNIVYLPNAAEPTPMPDMSGAGEGEADGGEPGKPTEKPASKPSEESGDSNEEGDYSDAGSDSKSFGKWTKSRWRDSWLVMHTRQEQVMEQAIRGYFNEMADDVAAKLYASLQKQVLKHGLRNEDTPSFMKPEAWTHRFTRAYDGTLAHRKTAPAIDDVMVDTFSTSAWAKKLKAALKPLWSRTATVGAYLEIERSKAMSRIDIPTDVMQRIRHFADESFNQDYWDDIAEDTRTKIADMIADGLDDSKTLREIVSDVREAINGNGYRARLIARTETTGALNAGHFAAQSRDTATRIRTKQWVSIIDDVTRPEHAELDGTEVDKDEDFDVGGEKAPFPGFYGLSPGMRCNCRCTLVAGDVDDDLDDGLGDLSDPEDDQEDEPDQDRSGGRSLRQAELKYDEATVTAACEAFLAKFNQNHDEQGRFTFGDGGGTATVEPGNHARALGAKLVTEANARCNSSIGPKAVKQLAQVAQEVAHRFPEKVAQKVSMNLLSLYTHKEPFTSSSGEAVEGVYSNKNKEIDLHVFADDPEKTRGVLAHELTHALDYKGEYSGTKEWLDAYAAEIYRPDGEATLSKYASSSRAEGFAEFGRAIFAGSNPWAGTGGRMEFHNLDAIAQKFPKCLKFWKDNGLLGDSVKSFATKDSATGQLLPELFSHPVVDGESMGDAALDPGDQKSWTKEPGHDVSDEPRDESGKWTSGGASTATADPPKTSPGFTVHDSPRGFGHGTQIKIEKPLGGSNDAKLVTVNSSVVGQDKKYVMKRYGGNEDRARTEAVANALYRSFRDANSGYPTPGTVVHPYEGKDALFTEYEKNGTLLSDITNSKQLDEAEDSLRSNFVTDAWLGNWDVVGLNRDNVIYNPLTANVKRIDNGGALTYRAQGAPKGNDFGPKVKEIDSLRDPDVNRQSAQVFASLTNQQLVDQMTRFESQWKDGGKQKVSEAIQFANITGHQADVLQHTLEARAEDIIRQRDELKAGIDSGHLDPNDAKYLPVLTDSEEERDEDGYDKDGYDEEGYDRDGYNADGYDADGYDKDGFDENGYDKDGYDKDGFNSDGYNAEGYNAEGFDENGYDENGYDAEGYDENGYDEDGYNTSGYNDEGESRDHENQELHSELSDSFERWVDNLSSKERGAITDYTGASYDSLNRELRQCPEHLDCLSPTNKMRLESIESALAKAHDVLHEDFDGPIETWRGISGSDGAKMVEKCRAAMESGQRVEFAGIVSSSIERHEAERFGSNYLFHIQAKSGAYIAPLSGAAHEREFIQPHGTKYYVTGIEKKGYYTIVNLEESEEPAKYAANQQTLFDLNKSATTSDNVSRFVVPLDGLRIVDESQAQ